MSDEVLITMMFPANVSKAWPQVARVLKPVVDLIGTHDIEDVRRAIVSGKSQLWVQWNQATGHCESALVSEFQDFPKGLFLNVWLFAAAEGKEPNEDEFEKQLFNFAFANGCIGMKHEGRKGWQRRHKHLPVKHENVVYYFMLKDLQEVA